MACLGNNTLLDLAGDRSPDRLRRFDEHLDACAECRRLVAELAELSWMRVVRDTEPVQPADDTLAAGHVVDRYIVIDRIGEGGMGVVYAAYDPRLDRKIALKVLRPDLDDADERGARLLREAKILARLHHPNVVAVHDAGVFDGQVYVAMELVDGTTLRRWLRDEDRTWREIIGVFLEAAAGLATAHATGVVHRDFKPENVLIGRDGRARVADFGLARSGERASIRKITVAASGDAATILADDAATVVAGTPAYMAPEQQRGAVSALADQYSFCVALHEALLGHRPGAPQSGVSRRVPARILAAVERGLSADPKRRHASMDALIPALRRRSPARLVAVAAALLACAGIGAFGIFHDAHAAGPTCDNAAVELAGVWDAPARETLRLRYLATGRIDAAETFGRVAARVDAYTGAWVAERIDSCEATNVRGEQSQARLDQRVGCLDLRRGELATRLAVLREVSRDNLADTPGVLASLVDPKSCSSRAALAHESTPAPSGEVSDFDDGTLASRFGLGWSPSTDSIMGGRSTARLAVVDGALAITGIVEQASSPIAWAGAMFYPGRAPMAPVDLSAHHSIAFTARGDAGTYEVLMFSQSKGDLPAFRPFEVGAEWREYRFPIAEFDGVNPADIKGLLFAQNRPGAFALRIDRVRFE